MRIHTSTFYKEWWNQVRQASVLWFQIVTRGLLIIGLTTIVILTGCAEVIIPVATLPALIYDQSKNPQRK